MGDYDRYLKQEVVRLQEENRSLHEEVATLRHYVDAIHVLTEAISQLDPTSPPIPLLDRILYNALVVTDAQEGSLLVRDDETDELVFMLVRGDVDREELLGYRLPPGQGIAGWVVKNRQPTIANNVRADERFYPDVDDTFGFQTYSILAAPIEGRSQIHGVIEVLNKHNNVPFNEIDQDLLMLLCRFAGEVLDAMLQQEENSAAAQDDGVAWPE